MNTFPSLKKVLPSIVYLFLKKIKYIQLSVRHLIVASTLLSLIIIPVHVIVDASESSLNESLVEMVEIVSESDDFESEATASSFLTGQEKNSIDWHYLADECQKTLNQYLSCFEGYSPLCNWGMMAKELVLNIILSLEKYPETASKNILLLQEHLVKLDALKGILIKEGAWNEEQIIIVETEKSPFLTRYKTANQVELIDALQRAMERRIYLWTLAAAWYADSTNRVSTSLAIPSIEEITRLRQATEEVRNFFGISTTGQSWRKGFEVDAMITDLERLGNLIEKRPVFSPISSETLENGSNKSTTSQELLDEQWDHLRGRANSISYKVESTPMNERQQAIFHRDPMFSWLKILAPYRSNRGDVLTLLWTFERYEQLGGTNRGRKLAHQVWMLRTSRSESSQKIGEVVHAIYDRANVKFYISEVLINRLLPIRDPEFDVVHEVIMNNPVAGKRRTDTQVAIRLVPDAHRLLMKLMVHGKVTASTSSAVFSAKLFNESYAAYLGEKVLEWKDSGLAYAPAMVNVNSVNLLSNVESEVDFVPVIGDLVRGIAKGQYELKQSDIQREVRDRVVLQARQRIDYEANERFDLANSRMKERFFSRLDRLGLSMKIQDSKTTSDWLLASLRFGGEHDFGSITTEPPTLPGAFADVKVHESTIFNFLSSLQLEGKDFTLKELGEHLSEKLELPQLAKNFETASQQADDLLLVFGSEDPLTVRFFEDRIQIRLALEAAERGESIWNDIVVVVSYRPLLDELGRTILVRDGLVQLEGPLNIRAQLTLRTIFSKVFPGEKPLLLEPPLWQTDERFVGLTTGLCRVSRGWFAIAVTRASAPLLTKSHYLQ